jgi:hypothetical protein
MQQTLCGQLARKIEGGFAGGVSLIACGNQRTARPAKMLNNIAV